MTHWNRLSAQTSHTKVHTQTHKGTRSGTQIITHTRRCTHKEMLIGAHTCIPVHRSSYTQPRTLMGTQSMLIHRSTCPQRDTCSHREAHICVHTHTQVHNYTHTHTHTHTHPSLPLFLTHSTSAVFVCPSTLGFGLPWLCSHWRFRLCTYLPYPLTCQLFKARQFS